MDAPVYFHKIVRAQKRGVARGAWSACSAHRLVLRAAMEQASADGHPVLVESTVNQVNQHGGYTGMRPADFAVLVRRVADGARFPHGSIILGADHLGPLPWRSRSASDAMGAELSDLGETLDRAMRDDPTHWRAWLHGDERELRLARRFGLSDRSRYYWTVPAVEASVARLMRNLARTRPPAGLVSQHLPLPYRLIAAGELPWDPEAVAVAAVKDALRPYAAAARRASGLRRERPTS